MDAFRGQDAIVSAISTSNNAKQKEIIDAAVEAGVKRFIPSEFGGNVRNPAALELLPHHMVIGKAEVINYLRDQESRGLSWSAIATGPFFDW